MNILRFTLVIVSIFFFGSILLAQCPAGDVILSTQKQINNFVKAYPNCNKIPGNVMIGMPYVSTDIHDLSPLVHIRTIGGYLNILNNSELQSLEGLENLISVGGYLIVYNNDRLKDINGLQNLNKTGGSLWVIKNESISSIEGLQNIKSINGSLDISDNPSLVSLEGIQHMDPTSIKPTLDFQLIKMIDIRTIVNHKITMDKWSKMLYEPTSKNLVKRFQSMWHKPYSKRAVETDLLYRNFESITDSVEVHGILDQFAAIARDSRIVEMKWEVELLKSYWQLKNVSAPLNQRIAPMQALANHAGQKGLLQVQARALKFISYKYLMQLREYEEIFSNYPRNVLVWPIRCDEKKGLQRREKRRHSLSYGEYFR